MMREVMVGVIAVDLIDGGVRDVGPRALLRLTHPTSDVLDGYLSWLGIEMRLVLGLI